MFDTTETIDPLQSVRTVSTKRLNQNGRTCQDKAKKVSVVSLFSGCGGMDLGFSGGFKFLENYYARQPFDIVWANDVNQFACKTYKYNLSKEIICGDVWSVINTLPKYADVIIGGFPCQDISVNGKRAGINGTKSGLYKAMVEAVARLQPQMFVAENVKGLLMKNHESSLAKVISDFSNLGYEVSYNLYHAAGFGVPQTRERVFIIGAKPGIKFEPPEEVLVENEYITARQAMADLEAIEEDPSINHIWSKANKSPDQGQRCLKADRPGYTIRAECHGNIQFHYSQSRRISMREAARIQSFPDDFIFQSKLRETERQVGNAVPPVLSWYIGKAILKALNK